MRGLGCLPGLCCADEATGAKLRREIESQSLNLDVKVTPTWYF